MIRPGPENRPVAVSKNNSQETSPNRDGDAYHPEYLGMLKISVNALRMRSGSSRIDGSSGPGPVIGRPCLLTGRYTSSDGFWGLRASWKMRRRRGGGCGGLLVVLAVVGDMVGGSWMRFVDRWGEMIYMDETR